LFLIINVDVSAQSKKQRCIETSQIVNSKAIELPEPVYSNEAKSANAIGKVKVEIVIDRNGNVSKAKAVSGNKLLHQAAIDAALKAKFAPILMTGIPPCVKAFLVYSFKLANTKLKFINAGVVNKSAQKLPKPEYPIEARNAGAEGEVKVEIVVQMDTGKVIEANAISGHVLLQESAVKAARKAEFTPAHINGARVDVKAILIYHFKLPDIVDVSGQTTNSDKKIKWGIINGKLSKFIEPKYPKEVREAGVYGKVEIEVVVIYKVENKLLVGRVTEAKAISGHPLLQSAAIDAVKKAKFAPTACNNLDIIEGIVVYNFTLPKKKKVKQ